MKSLTTYVCAYLLLLVSCSSVADVTREKAQHRLPPVMYSLDMPHSLRSGQEVDLNFSIMGYHDDYRITLNIYNENGNRIYTETVDWYNKKNGHYQWGNIRSYEFLYKTKIKVDFDYDQKLAVRFFASPPADPVDQTFLSLIIPGGHPYHYPDNTGRMLVIDGITGDWDKVTDYMIVVNPTCSKTTAVVELHFGTNACHTQCEPSNSSREYRGFKVEIETTDKMWIDYFAPKPESQADMQSTGFDMLLGYVPIVGNFLQPSFWDYVINGGKPMKEKSFKFSVGANTTKKMLLRFRRDESVANEPWSVLVSTFMGERAIKTSYHKPNPLSYVPKVSNMRLPLRCGEPYADDLQR